VLVHHIGLSDKVGFVRPADANFGIFTDNRNGRGVMIAYADRSATEDVTVDLPVIGLTAEDIHGNPVRLDGRRLALSKSGRPVILYTAGGDGRPLLAAMEPLDRKHLGFVQADAGGRKVYRLPAEWKGVTRGSSDGNPAMNGDQPVWRLDRLYPTDSKMPGNYSPMVWGNGNWIAPDHTQGGHPSGAYRDGVLRMGTLGPWAGRHNYRKQGALVFIVPEQGLYRLQATASSHPWGGTKAKVYLSVMKKDEQRVGELKRFALNADRKKVAIDVEVEAAEGHEVLLLTEMPNHNNSTNVVLENVTVTRQ